MKGLCAYKNALGAPGTGAHSIRVMNIAIVDVILTVIGGMIISYMIHRYISDPKISYGRVLMWVLIVLFILGIILHRIFCVETTIDKFLRSIGI